MIRPSELLNAADSSCYDHYMFYGSSELPKTTYKQKLKDGYGLIYLSDIEWEKFKLEKVDCYDYGKAIQSVCCGPISANFVAKVLDQYVKVDFFNEENGTLYINCILR